jgi:tRNA nucleotidyltransferase (CCA-adding enzyme)
MNEHKGSLVRGTFAIARRFNWTPLFEVLRAPSHSKMTMIMSEKTKLEQQVSTPEGDPNQVPEWLAGQLRRMNDQIMQETLPEDFLALLRQIESNERKR